MIAAFRFFLGRCTKLNSFRKRQPLLCLSKACGLWLDESTGIPSVVNGWRHPTFGPWLTPDTFAASRPRTLPLDTTCTPTGRAFGFGRFLPSIPRPCCTRRHELVFPRLNWKAACPEVSSFVQIRHPGNEKVSGREICERNVTSSVFRSEISPFNPRKPKQWSNAGKRRIIGQEGTQ